MIDPFNNNAYIECGNPLSVAAEREEILHSWSQGLASHGDSTAAPMARLWTITSKKGVLRFHGGSRVAFAFSDRRNPRLLDLMSLATISC